jgi:membrane-associated protease RseP (regulator of RpoE activity)
MNTRFNMTRVAAIVLGLSLSLSLAGAFEVEPQTTKTDPASAKPAKTKFMVPFEMLPVIVFDHPILGALGDAVDRRIDGIMGFTFFARYKTMIDYQAHRMTFEPVDFAVRDLLKDLPDRLMGPKVTRRRVLAPLGVWGLRLGEPTGALDSPGVAIAAVEDGSPAHRAGFKPGDVLTTLDGRWTTSIADVFHAAADVEPGRATAVVILRDGKEQTLTVTPAEGA